MVAIAILLSFDRRQRQKDADQLTQAVFIGPDHKWPKFRPVGESGEIESDKFIRLHYSFG